MHRFALTFGLVFCEMITQAAADEPQPAAVLVRVKVIDVDVTAARNIRAKMRASGITLTPESALLKRLQAEIAETPVPEDTRSHSFFLTADDPAHGVINGMRQSQVATVIAEPNIASAFGQPAKFNSGGEFPVPKDAAANSVEMREYGTRVETRVTEHGADQAVVEVAVRLSEIDEKRSIKSGKFVIPALRVYEANTGFEGKWGETFVLCDKRPDQKNGIGKPHKIVRMTLVTPERIAPLTPAVAAKPSAGIQ
ncbi:MAG TPA: hypothetical protein VGJ26_11640 [Pirellulales bacterium]|jgi:Flp pilus assembly secretin CpaC